MNGQRVIGITFIAIFMLVAIVLLIQAGRFIFNGDDSADAETTQSETIEGEAYTITDYIDSKARAEFINDGEIKSKEIHNRVEIEITPSKREIRIISGYNNKVTTRKAFKNSDQSYSAFMNALAFEGILDTQEAAYPSVEGTCPTGQRFIFNLDADGSDDDHSSWTTTCSRRHGDFAGDRRGIQNLFQDQIPEYKELTADISL